MLFATMPHNLKIVIGGSLVPSIRELISTLVREYCGYHEVIVRSASTPRELRGLADAFGPDLFVLYFRLHRSSDGIGSDSGHGVSSTEGQGELPDAFNIAVVRWFTKAQSKPVMVLSGSGDYPEFHLAVKNAGGTAFLALPFKTAELVDAVSNCLSSNS